MAKTVPINALKTETAFDSAAMSLKHYGIMEVAALLGVSRATVYVEISEGRLPIRKLGNRTLIAHTALANYIANLGEAA